MRDRGHTQDGGFTSFPAFSTIPAFASANKLLRTLDHPSWAPARKGWWAGARIEEKEKPTIFLQTRKKPAKGWLSSFWFCAWKRAPGKDWHWHCTGGERMNVYTQCVLHMTCNALHITQCVLIEMLTTSCQRSSSHHVYYPWLAMHYTLYNMCSRHDLQCNCTVTPVGNWKVRFQINFHWEKVKVSDASSTAVSTILKHTKLVAKWTFW